MFQITVFIYLFYLDTYVLFLPSLSHVDTLPFTIHHTMSNFFQQFRYDAFQLAEDKLTKKHSVQYVFRPRVHQIDLKNPTIYPVTFRRIPGDNFCAMFSSLNALSSQPVQREIIKMYNERVLSTGRMSPEFTNVCHSLFRRHKELRYLLPYTDRLISGPSTHVSLDAPYDENDQRYVNYIGHVHELLCTMRLTFKPNLTKDDIVKIKATVFKFYIMEHVQESASYHTNIATMFRHVAFAIYAAYSFITTEKIAMDACTIKTRGLCDNQLVQCCNLFILSQMAQNVVNGRISNNVQDMIHLSEVKPCLFPCMSPTIGSNEKNIIYDFGDNIYPDTGTKSCEIINTPSFFYVEIPGSSGINERIIVTDYEMVELPKNKETNESSKYLLTGVILKSAEDNDEYHYNYLDIRFNQDLTAVYSLIDDLNATARQNVNVSDYMHLVRVMLYTRLDHVNFAPENLSPTPYMVNPLNHKKRKQPDSQMNGDSIDMTAFLEDSKSPTFSAFCANCEEYEEKDLYDYLTTYNTHFESLCDQVKSMSSIRLKKIKHVQKGLYWLRRLSPLSCEDFFVGALNNVAARELYYEFIEDKHDSFDSRGLADMHKVRLYTNVNEREMYQHNHAHNSTTVWEQNSQNFYDKYTVQSNEFAHYQTTHQNEYPSLFNLIKIFTSKSIRNVNTELRCHLLLRHVEQGVLAQDLLRFAQDMKANAPAHLTLDEFLIPLIVFGTKLHAELYLRNWLFTQDFITVKTLNKNVALCSLAFTVYSTAMTQVLKDVHELSAPKNTLMVTDLLFTVQPYLTLISDILYDDAKQGRLTLADLKVVISITDNIDGHMNQVQGNARSLSLMFQENVCEAAQELHTCSKDNFFGAKTLFQLPCENIQTHLLENFGYTELEQSEGLSYDASRINRISYVVDKYFYFLHDQIDRQPDEDQRLVVSHSVLGEEQIQLFRTCLFEISKMFTEYLASKSHLFNDSKENVARRRKSESLLFLDDLQDYIKSHIEVFNKPLFILTNALFLTHPHYSPMNLYQVCLRLLMRDTDINVKDDSSHYYEFLIDAIVKCFVGVHYMNKDLIRDRNNSQELFSNSTYISSSILSFLEHKKIVLANTPIDDKLRILSIEDNVTLRVVTGKVDSLHFKLCDSLTEADKEDSFIWDLHKISYMPTKLMSMLQATNGTLHMKLVEVHKMIIMDHLSIAANQLNDNICCRFIFDGTVPIDVHKDTDMELKSGQSRMDLIYDALEKKAEQTQQPQMIMKCRQYYNNIKRALQITSLHNIFGVYGGKQMNETLWKIVVSIRISLLRDHKGIQYYYDPPVTVTSSASIKGTITDDLELVMYLYRQLIRYDKYTAEKKDDFASRFIYLLFNVSK